MDGSLPDNVKAKTINPTSPIYNMLEIYSNSSTGGRLHVNIIYDI